MKANPSKLHNMPLFLQTQVPPICLQPIGSKHCCTLKPFQASTNMRCSKAKRKFFPPKMTTMQRQVGVRSSLLSDGDCFDMWHDYMNLGRLLERLCDRRERDHGDTEGAKKDAPAAPWSNIQTSPREDLKNSPGTSSVSSLSDTSCSGTSSYFCRFCKQNGESARVYRSHRLKSDDGKVICPILWNYTCPICAATGDHAHTRRYCPQAQRQDAARKLPGSRFW